MNACIMIDAQIQKKNVFFPKKKRVLRLFLNLLYSHFVVCLYLPAVVDYWVGSVRYSGPASSAFDRS